ncbi:MAG: ATP-binding cassette domain-containing protein, partial [Alphaproteobacteria bacterium]
MSDHELAINVQGLRTQFGPVVVHDDLDLAVRKGEVFGVVGGSGTGKSVLLRTIIGLNRPSAGRIEVLGHVAGTGGAAAARAVRRR